MGLVYTTLPVTSRRSPCLAGAMNFSVSIDIVTNSRWANFEQEIPPALSIIDRSLPPNSVSWSLVSPGKMCSIKVTGSLE